MFILYKTRANDLGFYVHECVYLHATLMFMLMCVSASHRWSAGSG